MSEKLKVYFNAFLDALLSALMPGLGQVVQGRIQYGIIYFLGMILLGIIFIQSAIVLYVLCIVDAFRWALSRRRHIILPRDC